MYNFRKQLKSRLSTFVTNIFSNDKQSLELWIHLRIGGNWFFTFSLEMKSIQHAIFQYSGWKMSILFAINRFQLFSNGSRQNIERFLFSKPRDQNGSCNKEKNCYFQWGKNPTRTLYSTVSHSASRRWWLWCRLNVDLVNIYNTLTIQMKCNSFFRIENIKISI